MKSPVQILGNTVPEPRPRNLGSNRERGHSNTVGNASQKESKTIPMALARTSGSGGLPEQKSTNEEDMRGRNSSTSGEMVPGKTISISVHNSHGPPSSPLLKKSPFLLSEVSLGNSVPNPRTRSPGSNRERGHSSLLGEASQKESIIILIAMVRAGGSGSFPEEKTTTTEGMRGTNILVEVKWNSDTSGKMVPGETISMSVRSSHGHPSSLILENMEKRSFLLLSEGSEKESITIPMAMVRASGNGNFPTEKSTNTEGMRGMNIFMEAK